MLQMWCLVLLLPLHLTLLPQANCDLDEDNTIQYLILQRCGVHLLVPSSYFLPLPFLRSSQFRERWKKRAKNHLPHLNFPSSSVLNPSSTETGQGTNPEGGEAGLVSDDKLSYTFPSHHRRAKLFLAHFHTPSVPQQHSTALKPCMCILSRFDGYVLSDRRDVIFPRCR